MGSPAPYVLTAASLQGIFHVIWGSVFSCLSEYSSSTEAPETKVGDIQPWRWARGTVRSRALRAGLRPLERERALVPLTATTQHKVKGSSHKVVTNEGQVQPSEHSVSAYRSQPCARWVPLGGTSWRLRAEAGVQRFSPELTTL